MKKTFITAILFLMSANAFADCPQLAGNYHAADGVHGILTITQNGCDSAVINMGGTDMDATIDNKEHNSESASWIAQSLQMSSYYDFLWSHQVAYTDVFELNSDGSITYSYLKGGTEYEVQFTTTYIK